MAKVKIAIIISTTRAARFGDKPAKWIHEIASQRSDLTAEIVDLRDFPMPFFDQPVPPAMPGRPPYKNEVRQEVDR